MPSFAASGAAVCRARLVVLTKIVAGGSSVKKSAAAAHVAVPPPSGPDRPRPPACGGGASHSRSRAADRAPYRRTPPRPGTARRRGKRGHGSSSGLLLRTLLVAQIPPRGKDRTRVE